MTRGISLIGVLSLILAMFIWASSFIALKYTISELGEYTVIFFRMLTASLCFVFFIKGFRKLEFTKKDIKLIVLLAFFEPCLYFIFEAKALIYTSASQAGMIMSMMPLITALAAGYFLKEIISRKLLFGSLIAMIGAVWLSVHGVSSTDAPNPMLGNFLEFLAVLCATGYTIVARYLTEKYSALFITAIQAFIGAIFFFPFFIYEYSTKEINFTFDAMVWVVYLGIAVTLGGYLLYNYALTKIEASKTAIFVNLIPVFTVLLAYMILGEKFTQIEIYASITIFVGLIISQMPTKRRVRP